MTAKNFFDEMAAVVECATNGHVWEQALDAPVCRRCGVLCDCDVCSAQIRASTLVE